MLVALLSPKTDTGRLLESRGRILLLLVCRILYVEKSSSSSLSSSSSSSSSSSPDGGPDQLESLLGPAEPSETERPVGETLDLQLTRPSAREELLGESQTTLVLLVLVTLDQSPQHTRLLPGHPQSRDSWSSLSLSWSACKHLVRRISVRRSSTL